MDVKNKKSQTSVTESAAVALPLTSSQISLALVQCDNNNRLQYSSDTDSTADQRLVILLLVFISGDSRC